MTAPASPAAVTPAALSAFMRGVERRGFVLAWLQCGDAALAEQHLAAALRAFRSHAGSALMADWPVRFWSLLAATPALRTPPAGAWPPAFQALAASAPGDRLALLLRVVAGLDEPMAADVLGIDEDGYRQALARACPRDPDGAPDAGAWRALAEAAQQEVRALAPDQLARLAQLRDAAIAGSPVQAPPPAATETWKTPSRQAPPRRAGRRRWPGLLALLLLLLALAGGWAWWRQRAPQLPPEPVSEAAPGALHVVDAAPVLVEQLPADDAGTPPLPATELAAEDAAMLADPALDTARQADMYAWMAAGMPVPPDESQATPGAVEDAGGALETVDDE